MLGDELLAVVRVVGRLVHHRQHFAGGDVQHDDRAGLRARIPDRRLQLPIREILDAQIDGQHQVAAGARRANALHVLHDTAVAILDDPLLAVLTGEPVIERQLQAFLPRVIDVREPENVAGHFARRVIAAVLTRGIDARNAERLDLRGLGRLPAAGHVEKVAIEIARDTTRQLLAIDLQRAGEPRNLIAASASSLGFTHTESTGVLTASGSPYRR